MNLSILRETKNLTQAALAKQLGVGQSAVGNWESKKRIPSLKNIKKLSAIFNISIKDVVEYFIKN